MLNEQACIIAHVIWYSLLLCVLFAIVYYYLLLCFIIRYLSEAICWYIILSIMVCCELLSSALIWFDMQLSGTICFFMINYFLFFISASIHYYLLLSARILYYICEYYLVLSALISYSLQWFATFCYYILISVSIYYNFSLSFYQLLSNC